MVAVPSTVDSKEVELVTAPLVYTHWTGQCVEPLQLIANLASRMTLCDYDHRSPFFIAGLCVFFSCFIRAIV